MRVPLNGATPTIAVSPMAYARPGIWPRADETLFVSYISALTSACLHWLDKGYRIVLYTTASMDQETSVELQGSLVSARPHLSAAVELLSQTTVNGMLAILSQADICVTARLHGVILSQIVAVPTIAVVHDWKVFEQIHLAGQGKFALGVCSLTTSQIIDACEELLAYWHDARASLHEFASASAKVIELDLCAAIECFNKRGAPT
jgi:polysaccharide pyruvyl transferase WcaK-like protein